MQLRCAIQTTLHCMKTLVAKLMQQDGSTLHRKKGRRYDPYCAKKWCSVHEVNNDMLITVLPLQQSTNWEQDLRQLMNETGPRRRLTLLNSNCRADNTHRHSKRSCRRHTSPHISLSGYFVLVRRVVVGSGRIKVYLKRTSESDCSETDAMGCMT